MVYFITSGDFVKIGMSKHPKSRLAEMQTGSPLKLEMVLTIPGERDVEQALHVLFEKHHTHGEWFKFDQEIRDFITERGGSSTVPLIEDVKAKAFQEGAFEAIAHVVGQYWKYHVGIKHPDMFSAIRGYIDTFPVMRFMWAIDAVKALPNDPDYYDDRLAQMQDLFNEELIRQADIEDRYRNSPPDEFEPSQDDWLGDEV